MKDTQPAGTQFFLPGKGWAWLVGWSCSFSETVSPDATYFRETLSMWTELWPGFFEFKISLILFSGRT